VINSLWKIFYGLPEESHEPRPAGLGSFFLGQELSNAVINLCNPGGTDSLAVEDMKTLRSLDNRADLTCLQLKKGLIESTAQFAGAEPS